MLESVIQNRRWRRSAIPFDHVHALNVFRPDVYAALDRAFRGILGRGLSQTADPGRFSARNNNYTAYSLSLDADETSALRLFMSREWHDMIGSMFDLRLSGEIDICLHHHPPGSRSGWIHTDYSPGWFGDNPTAEGIHISSTGVVNYKSGEVVEDGQTPIRRMRAIAILFYLCNDGWTSADGGQTGLYESKKQSTERSDAGIPPYNNSIVMFECTPFSYHTFMGSPNKPRNAVVMWVHRPFEEAVRQWGEEAVSWWK